MLMTEDSLNSYYQNNFGSRRQLQGQIVNAKNNSWITQRLLEIGSIKTLLDIGTGYGFYMRELQDSFGIEATGVELSKQEASYGKEVMSLDIRNSSLAEAGLVEKNYDLVTCFEVIEHIPSPRSFISEMVEYIKPGGHLLIMTDNFESDIVKSLGAGFPKWIPHTHISHFSPKTLESLVDGAGLSVIRRASYTPWEIIFRNYYYMLRGIKRRPEEAYQLSHVLETEMDSSYKLFHLRKAINKIWTQITSRNNLDGALMYILAKRI